MSRGNTKSGLKTLYRWDYYIKEGESISEYAQYLVNPILDELHPTKTSAYKFLRGYVEDTVSKIENLIKKEEASQILKSIEFELTEVIMVI